MKQEFFNLEIKTNGQDLYEITDKVSFWIEKNNFKQGNWENCYIFKRRGKTILHEPRI